MEKNVRISICGLHTATDAFGPGEEDRQRAIFEGGCYLRNGKYYILYDEVSGEGGDIIRNRICISAKDRVEIRKSGALNTHMVFEQGKQTMSHYYTSFGQIQMEIDTKYLTADIAEDRISIHMEYELKTDGMPLSLCTMEIEIINSK